MLKSIFKKLAYVVAGCIIMAALIISIARFITPILDDHRADLEKWASQLLEMPVKIDHVQATWYRYQPEITLDHVTILDKKTEQPILQIKKVSVFLSIVKSLWQFKPIPSGVLISGIDANIYENKKGEISVQGFPVLGGFNTTPYQDETALKDILAWLSVQPKMTLANIDVSYTPFTGPKRYVRLHHLSLENFSTKHLLLGKATLLQDIPTALDFGIQWKGNELTLEKIKAKIYLHVTGLSLSQWLAKSKWYGWKINQGLMSAKIWATWDQGQFQKIQSEFQAYGLDLNSDTNQSHHRIRRLSGSVGWKTDGENYILAGQDIILDLPHHLWPVTNFYAVLGKGETFSFKTLNFGYLDIKDVRDILAATPALSAETTKLLNELDINGQFQEAAISFATPWTDWRHAHINTSFTELSVLPWQKFPGINHLTGSLKWDGLQGQVKLKSNHTQIKYSTVFSAPLIFNEITGTLNINEESENNWAIHIPELNLSDAEMTMNLNGTMTVPASYIPVVDLNANFSLTQAQYVNRYLPLSIFEPELVDWLQKAFIRGRIKSGHAILRGNLNDFPFDHENGLFEISAAVNNVELHYGPDWPNLKDINGKLIFSGRRMDIDVDRATILDIPVAKVHAIIPYLGDEKPQILEVQSETIRTDLQQGLIFLKTSPLKKTIGKLFANIQMTGEAALKLGLIVPLKNPDDTKVNGDLVIANSELRADAWDFSLQKIKGKLNFTENSITAKNLEGQLFQRPIVFNLTTIPTKAKKSLVQADFTTQVQVPVLEKWLKLSMTPWVKGSTEIKGTVDFSLDNPMEVKLHSNLQGIALELPKNYGKQAQAIKNFSADIILAEHQPLRIKTKYDNLSAALLLDKKDDKFNLIGINLLLGTGETEWPQTPGLSITANFDQLDWEMIKVYIDDSGSSLPASLPLRKIDIRAKILNIFGQRLNQVTLRVSPKTNFWDIDISSAEVSGQITVPSKIKSSSLISANFKRIKLRSQATANKNSSLDFKTIPSIAFTAGSVNYNNMQLGQVNFRAQSTSNGLSIQSLSINSPHINLQATGDWQRPLNMTRLQGTATSNNVSNLLNSLGFDVHNFISNKGKFTFNLNWHGLPFSPELRSLNGDASLDIANGRIVDVDQTGGAKMGIGKMLSIFSLQSIPRRLTLDFSDVVQKGYSFDSLKGTFNLKNGDAYTQNTRFDGAVAGLAINGRIGLARKDFDFTLSVTPYITSSVPVAATLITMNPLVGVAAFAVNKVVGTAVSQVTTYYYSVTGPWSNPSFATRNSR